MNIVKTRIFTRLVIGPFWFEVLHMGGVLSFYVGVFRREGHAFPKRDRDIKVVIS